MRLDADGADGVDQQGHVDAVARPRTAAARAGVAAAGVLAGQRLGDLGQLGEEQRQQRAGQQLGDPAAADAVGLGPVVVALHEVDRRVGEQRAEQAER